MWNLPWFEYEQEQIVLEKVLGRNYTPAYKYWYRALELTPQDQVKVVILGQDPYPSEGVANGLAFSVDRDFPYLPPSAQNILKELESDVGVQSNHFDLTYWAKQGVLLFNARLTCDVNRPNSHREFGWDFLTTQVLSACLKTGPKVYILWGNEARDVFFRTKEHHSDHNADNLILTSSHPSPMSAHRGFFGSRPFSKTNEYLSAHGLTNIDWRLECPS